MQKLICCGSSLDWFRGHVVEGFKYIISMKNVYPCCGVRTRFCGVEFGRIKRRLQ
jgi:hypothetical protein